MKYDWIALEKEFITSDYKSVSAFLKDKGISNNGSTKSKTKGWKNKKVQKEDKKSTKTIEKIIELESTNDAKKIVDLNDLANDLANDILEARKELRTHLAKKTKKSKEVIYDYKTKKPSKEIINETEELVEYESIIDKKSLRELTAALKDVTDIKNALKASKEETTNNEITKVKNIMVQIKEVANNDTD